MSGKSKLLRCLIVEDSADDTLLLLDGLRAGGFDVTSERVDTAEAMQSALTRQTWDLILSDFKMPHFSGTAALELLKASGLDLPFIIVSGTIGEELAVEAMKAGAHDYVMKDRLARLVPAVQRELRDALVRCERRQTDAYREMGLEVLRLLNEQVDPPDSIRRVVAALKTGTGFDAVGIRLQAGEDFPYFAQQGFSKDFLLTENTLVARAADGGLCLNKDGTVCLECTCGLVISGRTDPANPLFTPGGSCWLNDTFPLLAIPASEDPRLHPRNQCIHHGYASVALVPIRNKERTVGLIQFNDRRKGRFTLATVEILEGIAAHLGEALMRQQGEEALRKSEGRLRTLVQTIPDLIWLKDDNGTYLSCNAAFERFFGAPEAAIIGKTDYDFVAKAQADSFRANDQAAMAAGGPTTNEEWLTFARDGYRGLFQTIKTPMHNADGKLVGILGVSRDITERNQAEEALRVQAEQLLVRNATLERFNAVAVGRELRMIELKHEVNELCGKLHEPPRHQVAKSEQATPAEQEAPA